MTPYTKESPTLSFLKYTEDDFERAEELRAEGNSWNEVCDAMGIRKCRSFQVVYHDWRHGNRSGQNERAREKWDFSWYWVQLGAPVRFIAYLIGISVEALHVFLLRNGVDKEVLEEYRNNPVDPETGEPV